MSYTPNTWANGDVITSAKLNNIEQGIANAGGGGGALVLTDTEGTLNKTWQEIHDSEVPIYIKFPYDYGDEGAGVSWYIVQDIGQLNGTYYVSAFYGASQSDYASQSADGYPALSS